MISMNSACILGVAMATIGTMATIVGFGTRNDIACYVGIYSLVGAFIPMFFTKEFYRLG
jgi:hypothetical protein